MIDNIENLSDILIGTVQGRLVPSHIENKIQVFPEKNWMEEFSIASVIDCRHIEWILTNQFNPIMNMTHDDIQYIRDRFKVKIDVLCYDRLITQELLVAHLPLNFFSEHICDVIRHCAKLNIKTVVLPLLECASIWVPSIRFQCMDALKKISHVAHENDVRLSFETDLPAIDVVDLAEQFDAGITFDMGNLARRGYNLIEHIETYGHLVDNIHIKDCTRGGMSVPLGSGDADMSNLRRLLVKSGLSRVTLQVCRPRKPKAAILKPTDVEWFIFNAASIRMWINNPSVSVHTLDAWE